MKVSDGVMLKPSVLLKAVNAAPPQVDLNIHALFQEKIWVGAGWRTGDGIVGMMEIQVTPSSASDMPETLPSAKSAIIPLAPTSS